MSGARTFAHGVTRETLSGSIARWARAEPGRICLTVIRGDDVPLEQLSYGELDRQAMTAL